MLINNYYLFSTFANKYRKKAEKDNPKSAKKELTLNLALVFNEVNTQNKR